MSREFYMQQGDVKSGGRIMLFFYEENQLKFVVEYKLFVQLWVEIVNSRVYQFKIWFGGGVVFYRLIVKFFLLEFFFYYSILWGKVLRKIIFMEDEFIEKN